MFRSVPAPAPAPEPAGIEQGDGPRGGDMIPLSVLRLDLDPGEPWPLFLGRRGIAFRPDRIGRDAVTAGDAQRLLAERRAHKLRNQAVLRAREAEAVEADERRRALIWKGVPSDAMPSDASPASVMLQAAKDARPRRQSMVEAAFANDGTVMHTFNGEAED